MEIGLLDGVEIGVEGDQVMVNQHNDYYMQMMEDGEGIVDQSYVAVLDHGKHNLKIISKSG